MRTLFSGSIAGVVALFALPTNSAEPSNSTAPTGAAKRASGLDVLDDIAAIVLDRNIQRSLPSGTVIGGNLVRAGDWYVLSESEISAVRTSLKQERHYQEDGIITAQYAIPPYRVVLWGVVDGKIVPLYLLGVSRSADMFTPADKKGGWIELDGKEQECLQKLIRRIEEGKEQPVAKAPATGDATRTGSDETSRPKEPTTSVIGSGDTTTKTAKGTNKGCGPQPSSSSQRR
jgi:hypothetical protein